MSDDYDYDYEDDFVEETTPKTAIPTANLRAVSISKSTPTSTASTIKLTTATSNPVDTARIKELEGKLEVLEKEVSASRVKLRRAGRTGLDGTGGGDSFTSSSTTAASASIASSCPSSELGSNTAREIAYSSIQLGEQISGGGFCLLYKSRWCGLDVAVKRIFDPKITDALKAEFFNEVSMLANLQHPHIVQILAQVSSPPNLCIVTEFLPRGSLYHVLHESQVEMTKARKISMTLQIATALQFIHQCGIVHRDIKSHNALADEYLKVKICDFGMAISLQRLLSGPKQDCGGTPNYLSPEMYNGQPASIQSDIYAFGILMNEIWSREVPFDGLGPQEIQRRVLQGERPKTELTVPREITAMIKECTAQLPTARPKDLNKIIGALTQLQLAL